MQEGDNVGKITGFFLFRNLLNKYNEIRNDDRKRMTSSRFGRISLVLGTLSLILSGSMFLMFGISAFGAVGWMGFGQVTMMFSNIVAGVLVPAVLSIYAFVFAVLQVRLNRRASGIVGIVVATIAFVLISTAFVHMFLPGVPAEPIAPNVPNTPNI